jgi:Spy/CpxP family protein refolding chaperone
MTLKTWLLGLSVALNLILIGALLSDRLPLATGDRPGHSTAMPYEALNLSDRQKALFEGERDRFHGRLMEIRQSIRSRQDELIRLLSVDKPDRPAIAAKQQEILGLQDGLQNSVIAHILEVSAPLNPEQRERFFGLLQERMVHQAALYPPGCY